MAIRNRITCINAKTGNQSIVLSTSLIEKNNSLCHHIIREAILRYQIFTHLSKYEKKEGIWEFMGNHFWLRLCQMSGVIKLTFLKHVYEQFGYSSLERSKGGSDSDGYETEKAGMVWTRQKER